MENYNDFLDLFTSQDKLREAFLKPFKAGCYGIATNAYLFAYVDKGLVSNLSELEGFTEDQILKVIPSERNCDFDISVSELKIAIDKCPLKRVIEKRKDKCPKCEGEGYVECDLGHMHECRQCDGDGEVSFEVTSDRLEPDKSGHVKINNTIINIRWVWVLIEAADLLELDSIKVVYENKKLLLKMKDAHVLVNMAVYSVEHDTDSFVHHIKIQENAIRKY